MPQVPLPLGTWETTDADQPAELTRPARPRRRVLGLKLRDGRRLLAGATIITTGTFLNGLIHCGEERYPAGRSGEPASVLLGEALRALGLRTLQAQDWNAPAPRRPHHSLGHIRRAARRRRTHSVQLPNKEDRSAANQLPASPSPRRKHCVSISAKTCITALQCSTRARSRASAWRYCPSIRGEQDRQVP